MKATLILTALALAAGTSFAQSPTMGTTEAAKPMPRNERREAMQERRIEQGANSGQLTPREKERLENQQGRIDKAQDRAAADGKVTARERARVENMQDKASANIQRQKHDRQRDMNHDGRKDRPQGDRPNAGRATGAGRN